jgi:hypothetical protein
MARSKFKVATAGKSTKFQPPSSKEAPNFKLKTPNRSHTACLKFGAWSFSGAWRLVLGAYLCFA